MLVVGFRINGPSHVTCCILAFNVRCTLGSCDCQVKFVGNDVRVWHVAHARDLRSFAGLRVAVVVYSGCCASMHPFVTPCRSSSQEKSSHQGGERCWRCGALRGKAFRCRGRRTLDARVAPGARIDC